MKRELKERFERAGPIRAIARVFSGSPAVVSIRVAAKLSDVRTISAIRALAMRGAKMIVAKRAVERMVEKTEAVIALPTVESWELLAGDLRAAGVEPIRIAAQPIDIAALRASLDMTQEEFALRYNLKLRALQNWEQGREPDPIVWNYLRAIARNPEEVARSQEVGPIKTILEDA